MTPTVLRKLSAALLFAAIALLPYTASMQQKGGEEETGPYDVIEKWPQPWAKPGNIWGSQPGVFAESPDRIWGSLGERATVPTAEMRNTLQKHVWIVNDSNGLHGIDADRNGRVYVADRGNQRVQVFDANGKLLYFWGTYGTYPGGFWELHQFSVDSEGNLYAADSFGGRTQKYTPKPGADASRLVPASTALPR